MPKTIETAGLNLLVNGIVAHPNLYIIARDISAQNDYGVTVTYSQTVTGQARLFGTSYTIAVTDSGANIDEVVLVKDSQTYAIGNVIGRDTDIDQAFANGGNLIVDEFIIAVVAS